MTSWILTPPVWTVILREPRLSPGEVRDKCLYSMPLITQSLVTGNYIFSRIYCGNTKVQWVLGLRNGTMKAHLQLRLSGVSESSLEDLMSLGLEVAKKVKKN